MSHDLHALTGAYALDALSEQEAVEFEEHLHHCPACRREVAEFQATASELGTAAASGTPSGMRTAVLDRIAVTRQDSPRVVALPVGPASRLRRLAMPVAAALAAVAVGLGLVVGQLNGRLDEVEQREELVMALMAQPDLAMVASPGPAGSMARAMLSPSRGEGVVVFQGMQPAPSSQVFQLWMISGDDIQPADVFDVGPDGRATRILRGDMTGVTAIGVTIEPAGGSPQPTSAPLMVLEVKA